ncbi:hypothetical protein K469DRAFT_560691 [Zopfia rhizophila CBS 207.26]|uniref:F-box domain-containing protein n=1 Tax=Zopfia rhizophila CBS 207.26 TaxID=1314779 RepID=A0A6A6EEI4_9PEZI|nr:hypothetical protein K469DRAFT_560691 [Zopfia rhizophila CBS 207.26]
MGTPKRPTVLDDDDDNETPRPKTLARHFDLGFDANDILALLSAIEASQACSSPQLSHIPAEVLLNILDYIPVAYILPFRLVCRGFRDAIDTRVLYSYLPRTRLIGYVGPKYKHPLSQLSPREYQAFHLVSADFERLSYDGIQKGAKWDATYAFFRIEERWFELLEELGGLRVGTSKWDGQLCRLDLDEAPEHYGTLRWAVRLDQAVNDAAFPNLPSASFEIDFGNGMIRVLWKRMLLRFLTEEYAIRMKLEEKQHSQYTFSHHEDCLRAVRRDRLRRPLNPDDKDDRMLIWGLKCLRPLFGQRRYDRASSPWDGIEDAEDDAAKVLLLLRKEAAMSPKECEYLQQLAKNRDAMVKQMSENQDLFNKWQSKLYSFPRSPYWESGFPTELDPNPLAWSDETRAAEEERLGRWASQQKTVEQFTKLLQGSIGLMEVPVDAFDDIDSDI